MKTHSHEELKAKLDRAREKHEKLEHRVLDLSRKLKEAQKDWHDAAEEVSRAHVAYSRAHGR